jgi:hypothetical protein
MQPFTVLLAAGYAAFLLFDPPGGFRRELGDDPLGEVAALVDALGDPDAGVRSYDVVAWAGPMPDAVRAVLRGGAPTG